MEEGDRGGHGPKIGPFGEFRGALEVAKRCMKWDQDLNYESLFIWNEVDIQCYCSVILIGGHQGAQDSLLPRMTPTGLSPEHEKGMLSRR